MKRFIHLLFLICTTLTVKAQTDTVLQKIHHLPYTHVDVNAMFPGELFEKFLSDHINIRSHLNKDFYGKAVLAMKIDASGLVSDIRLLKTLLPDIDKEIMRVATSAAKWQPALVNNSPVSTYVVYSIAVGVKADAPPAEKKQISITKVNPKTAEPPKLVARMVSRPKSVLIEPEFIGGTDAFGKYLRANIHYPESAKKNKIGGIVMIVFVINADGTIGGTRITSSPSPELALEATRVIKASPRWKPATENGRPVEYTNTVPINFQLQ